MEKGRGKASVPRDADITQLQTEPAKASREIEPAGTRSRETSSLTASFQIFRHIELLQITRIENLAG